MASYVSALNKKALLRFTRATLARRFTDGPPAEAGSPVGKKGLVLGVYSDADEKEHKLTSAAQAFNSQIGGKLEDLLRDSPHLRKGKSHVFQNMDSEVYTVAVVGLGKEDVGFNPLENLDECKENIRCAAAVGARRLRKLGMTTINVEGFGHTESSAEGAGLAVWRYQEYKDKEHQKQIPTLELYHDDDKDAWLRGLFKADAQNLARKLCDAPANLMTPALFSHAAVEALCPCGVSVEVRDRDWLENKKMSAFLTVARSSCEPPVFLEMGYCGGPQDQKPIVLVGKGITFDSGGLNVKPCEGMHEYRADLTGAAAIVATMKAIASLTLPINVQAVIPLCENLPSGMAMKPGDVVVALNGMSIVIEDTDNEGHLLFADAITYATTQFKPRMIIDIGSVTEGMRSALGSAATGVYTNNHDLWAQMKKAGSLTGDRVWRFPLWQHYTNKVVNLTSADVTNDGPGGGIPCKAAAFLKEFVSCGDWIHMDTTGTGLMANAIDFPYLSKGRMTGRPTRTLIQFLYQMACPPVKQAET